MSNEFELFRDEVSSLIYMQAGKIETVRGLEFLDKIPEQELRDILSKTYVNIRKDLLNSKEKFEHPLGQYKNYNDFLISTGTVKLELNPNQPFYGTKFKLEGLLQAESINDIIQDSLEDEDFTDEDDIEPFAFKLGQRIESIEEEKGWIKQRLPKIPVQDIFVFKKLTGIDNPDIIGVFYNAAIYLSEYGERGTGYHEAFHAVFRLYLSETEREDLYNQIRTELGNERDWSKIAKLRSAYPELSGNELNLLYLEEELADKFQEYVLTNKANKSVGKVGAFFLRLWNFIKGLLGSKTSYQQVFDRIKKGEFQHNPIKRNVARFKDTKADKIDPRIINPITKRERVKALDYQIFKA